MAGHIGQTVAYLRVSSEGQNLARQEELAEGCDRVFREKASGSTRERPVLKEMLDYLREGDSLKVWSLDRLARSVMDLSALVFELTEKGVTVSFEHESLTFFPSQADPYSSLMLGLLGSVAQFEREILRQRQAEGIAKAKARGVYTGRKPALSPEQVTQVREQVAAGIPKTVVAKTFGVSRQTVYAVLADKEEKAA